MNKPILTDHIEVLFESIIEHWAKIVAALAVGTLVAISVAGYRSYRRSAEERAYRSFTEAMKYFNGTVTSSQKNDSDQLTFTTETDKWQAVEKKFSEGYEAHRSSRLAGTFQLFQAEALLAQGKLDEALELTRHALQKVPSRSVADFYRVKLALMLFDKKTEGCVKEGLEILESLAAEQHNVAQGVALYRLGEYFWTMENFDRAKGYWQQFVGKFGDERMLVSQVEQVKEKLSLLVV